ncbi:hypothetical protein DL1_08330 [Thioclava dalianensis]|uniref:Uncharacterized protein n=1 Tax=Thioclava dalianensis TaxID=1185766 RepID=A0A074U2K8_9RHOB|nr:LPO_1073/Vpar_1526 family protein [Thioclava dalianensis]KEP68887.1 hypothetical protein DL1_08330 [Thioclava dalianensis]SFN22288.1 hypothetical protein SAMN05216224_10321 [Thioclava dalianensis]
MLGDQKQNATEGSTAIQAKGDVTVNGGLSPTQMVEILSALTAHVETLGNACRAQIEDRLKIFEAGVLERFAADGTTRSEAFREPDFLAATLDAQKAFARSGDEGLREVLTDLVAQRSKVAERSRLSLTLNDAIAKVGSIPDSDLNTLSMMFIFQNIQINTLTNIQELADYYSRLCLPLLDNISTSQSAINYLAAHGCVIPPSGLGIYSDALEIFSSRYGDIITKGVSEADLRDKFTDYDLLLLRGLIVESPYGNGRKAFAVRGPQLEKILPQFGIYGEYSERYKEVTRHSQPSGDEFQGVMNAHFPRIAEVMAKYNEPIIRNSRLTSIGIALAHANLAKGPLQNVDLSIWIKP